MVRKTWKKPKQANHWPGRIHGIRDTYIYMCECAPPTSRLFAKKKRDPSTVNETFRARDTKKESWPGTHLLFTRHARTAVRRHFIIKLAMYIFLLVRLHANDGILYSSELLLFDSDDVIFPSFYFRAIFSDKRRGNSRRRRFTYYYIYLFHCVCTTSRRYDNNNIIPNRPFLV